MKFSKNFYLKMVAIIVAIMPLLWLIYLITTNQLGADPAKDIQHFTGTTTINFLLATLTLSPLVQLFHLRILHSLRRVVGLTTFFWALAHILSYWLFELAGDIPLFFSEIVNRTYLSIGAIAWVGLLLLATTSNQFSIKRLKKKWKKLHNLIYPIAMLCTTHYYMALKIKSAAPVYYFVIFITLWINHLVKNHKKTKHKAN